MATDQPPVDHDLDTPRSIQFRPPFATGGLVDTDGCLNLGDVDGQYLPLPPRTAGKSREIWLRTAEKLGLSPTVRAAVTAEQLAAAAAKFTEDLGRAAGTRGHVNVILDEIQTWPPYIRRASGRITWARPIRSTL